MKKARNKQNEPLSECLNEGMTKARKFAIEKAIATNTCIVVWQDNKVVRIPPSELKKRLKLYG